MQAESERGIKKKEISNRILPSLCRKRHHITVFQRHNKLECLLLAQSSHRNLQADVVALFKIQRHFCFVTYCLRFLLVDCNRRDLVKSWLIDLCRLCKTHLPRMETHPHEDIKWRKLYDWMCLRNFVWQLPLSTSSFGKSFPFFQMN